MIKRLPALTAAILLLTLVACGPPSESPQAPTEEPTTETAAEPTAEPAEESAEESAGSGEESEPSVELGGAPAGEIQYTVIEEGTGESPEQGEYLKVDFVGTLADGSEFVNSYEIGEPLVFPFGQGVFFPGWDMALERMSIGETAEFVIPADLAFGDQGAGDQIPPGSDLYFEVELVDVVSIEYEEVTAGDGPQPEIGDTVSVHYVGTLEDGTEFDSSRERGEPIEFPLGQGFVIPGWEIGIGMMNEGGEAILTIPSELAYGSQGSPPVIPPDATLTFEVELVSVTPAGEAGQPAPAEPVPAADPTDVPADESTPEPVEESSDE